MLSNWLFFHSALDVGRWMFDVHLFKQARTPLMYPVDVYKQLSFEVAWPHYCEVVFSGVGKKEHRTSNVQHRM